MWEVESACWGVWAGPEQNSSAHFLGHGQAGLSPVRPDTHPAQRREAGDTAKRECSERVPSQMRRREGALLPDLCGSFGDGGVSRRETPAHHPPKLFLNCDITGPGTTTGLQMQLGERGEDNRIPASILHTG